jgi:Family of unknown function (DUF5677)
VTSRNPLRIARAALSYHARSVLRGINRFRGNNSEDPDDPFLSGAIQATHDLMNRGLSQDEALQRVMEKMKAELEDEKYPPLIVRNLEADMPRMLHEYRRHDAQFERRLYRRWARPLDLFYAIVVATIELGEHQFRDASSEELDENQRAVLEAVSAIHARACRTSMEVYELLKSGFPMGAQARARTLHELAVTATILSDFGDQPGHEDIGARFLAYDKIQSSLDAKEYQKHASRLNDDPLTAEELADVETARLEALREFPDLDKPGGWARGLPDVHSGRFIDLEKIARLDHLRPYYSWASQEVHASPKGVRLNTVTGPDGPVKQTGRFNYGLADGAQTALIALQQVNGALLASPGVSTFLSVVGAQALQVLVDKACDEFVAVQRRMKEEFGLT